MALSTCGRVRSVQRDSKKLQKETGKAPIPPIRGIRRYFGTAWAVLVETAAVYRSFAVRTLAVTGLLCILSAPVPAAADVCVSAWTGPGGSGAVVVIGDGPCLPSPPHPPPPPPEPPPEPPPPPPQPPEPPPEPSEPPPPPPPPPEPEPEPPVVAEPAPVPPPVAPPPVRRAAEPPAAPPPAPSPSPSVAPPPPPPKAGPPVVRVLPAYKTPVRKQPTNSTSVVMLMLLLTAPAVLAAAILRPRSSR